MSYEPDTGDISLSLPSSSSEPQLAALLSDPRRPGGLGHRRDVSSPTPSRFSRPHEPPSLRPTIESPTRATTSRFEAEQLKPVAGPSRPPPNIPPPMMKRLSSGVHRSRSLNVRLPSVDLSNNPGPQSASALTPSTRLGFSRRPGEPRPPPLITPVVYQSMSRWVKEIVVCNFDLERGPVVERRVAGRRWGPGEKENV